MLKPSPCDLKLSKKRAPLQDITSDFSGKISFCHPNLIDLASENSLLENLLRRESAPCPASPTEFDFKLFKWLAEIVYKKQKTVATFDRTISLYLRAGQKIQITTQNCQQVILACFDIISRLIEVRYVAGQEIIKWINSD